MLDTVRFVDSPEDKTRQRGRTQKKMFNFQKETDVTSYFSLTLWGYLRGDGNPPHHASRRGRLGIFFWWTVLMTTLSPVFNSPRQS
jgi:hypothetical protein